MAGWFCRMYLPRSRINGCFSEPSLGGRANCDAGSRLLLVKASGEQPSLNAAAALHSAGSAGCSRAAAGVSSGLGTAAVRAGAWPVPCDDSAAAACGERNAETQQVRLRGSDMSLEK